MGQTLFARGLRERRTTIYRAKTQPHGSAGAPANGREQEAGSCGGMVSRAIEGGGAAIASAMAATAGRESAAVLCTTDEDQMGSCNHKAGTIRLNTELAKKPAECLEYIVVHELVHFLEPTHNARFVALMDRLMPKWQFRRQVLNRLPVRREKWGY